MKAFKEKIGGLVVRNLIAKRVRMKWTMRMLMQRLLINGSWLGVS